MYTGWSPAILFKIAQSSSRSKHRLLKTGTFKSPGENYRFSGRDSGSLEPGGVFVAASSDHRQQAAGSFILGDEGSHPIQDKFWNPVVTGNHNDWNLWLELLYFVRDLMPVHLGHVVVDDHGSRSKPSSSSMHRIVLRPV
jgi:hypothetical protein